jgi:hypothetical protein
MNNTRRWFFPSSASPTPSHVDAERPEGQPVENSHFVDLRERIVVTWVAWWSWAYIRSTLGHRFPQLLAWLWPFY